jgi:chemotaxis protein histidine kinase CheA
MDMRKFIELFCGEERDHLSRLEAGLAVLEAAPDEPEAVNALFRSAHTITGSARMLKLSGICETAHRMEDLLGALRAGHYRPEPTGIGLLLQGTEPIDGQKPQGGQGQTKGFVVAVAQPPQALPHQHRGAPSVVPFEV